MYERSRDTKISVRTALGKIKNKQQEKEDFHINADFCIDKFNETAEYLR